ncbi:MAG: sfp [Gammaproteobacteria bacterium]|jgi:4'-phosphopantetheinyl transferase|nr:sfp [Gammaproteobacteria bacterium]
MNTLLPLLPQVVHLWLIKISDFILDESSLLSLLSPDEVERAMRFHFPLHRQQFIITRGLLRKTLSRYTGSAAKEIAFIYGPQGKPFLKDNSDDLQFNVSHSADLAVFAVTTQQNIGVDIEKIEPPFKEDVARRFFSQKEYTQLLSLTDEDQIKVFFQIWAKKEALIKALGQGLWTSLSSFSVSIMPGDEAVRLTHLQETYLYHVKNFLTPEGYQAAFATSEPIQQCVYYSAHTGLILPSMPS